MNYYIPTQEQLKGLLDWSITQFRVPIKLPEFSLITEWQSNYKYKFRKRNGACVNIHEQEFLDKYAPYQKDQIIYCKEAFQLYHWNNEKVAYKANGEDARYRDQISAFSFNKWRSPIHMTKDQARLWLRITDTRVERVQEITGADLLKEGVKHGDGGFKTYENRWNSQYAKKGYGFDSNCLTQVCEVRREG